MSDEPTAIATRHESSELSVEQVIGRLDKIQELTRKAMVKGIDYGIIPGTGSKPTLLKPGAEKLCVMFRFAPEYKTEKHFHTDGHLTVECTCKILDLGGSFLGEASAMCSTRESKYRYRGGARLCPTCQKPAIIKGRKEYGGGWLCFAKKGGCGAKFPDADDRIMGQSEAKVENPDLADSYNTVLRIAEKRALIGAVRLVTGSSALFDEEIPNVNEREPERRDESHDYGPDEGMHKMPHPETKAATSKPQPQPDAKILAEWEAWLKTDPNCAEVNAKLPEMNAESGMDPWTRAAIWPMIKAGADAAGWTFSPATKQFVVPNNQTFA